MRRNLLGLLAWSVAFATLLAIAIFVDAHGQTTFQQEVTTALKEAGVSERVSVHGRTYEVFGGHVYPIDGSVLQHDTMSALTLAFEKTVARRAPLFALPDVDLAQMDRVVTNLANLQRDLSDVQSSQGERQATMQGLYPIRFLRATIDLESARRRFLLSGSSDDAYAYAQYVQHTIATFRNDIRNFEISFREVVPEDVGNYVTERSLISRSAVLVALSHINERVDRAEKKISQRLRCISGVVWACDYEDIALPKITIPTLAITQESRARLAQDVVDILIASGHPLDRTKPLVDLSSSRCIGRSESTAALFVATKPIPVGGERYLNEKYVGDIRLIRTSDNIDVPFVKDLAAHDLVYIPDSPLNYYHCQEVARDLGKISTIRSVRDFAWRLQSNPTVEPLLLLAGKQINTEDPITEFSVATYLNTAQQSFPSLPLDSQNELTTLMLRFRTMSDGILQTILNIIFIERQNLVLQRQGMHIDLAAPYLFFVRNPFLALFMVDAIIPADEQITFFAPSDNKTKEKFYTYFSKNQDMNRTQLVNDLRTFDEIHSNPI